MKMITKVVVFIIFGIMCLSIPLSSGNQMGVLAADDECGDCYIVYDAEDLSKVLFMKGDKISVSDQYISADNKLYVIDEVNEEEKTGKAKFIENVKMPVYNITKKNNTTEVNAAQDKRIGLYHTHNDECYDSADGTDSVYGKGGIHDVGAQLKSNLETLGIEVFYSEALHLPHDSGAYSRSLSTANELLANNLDAIFDIHRDATPRSEYITSVNGEEMSKVRMVIGSANANSEVNKEFALSIKAYADNVYPGLIKDIYIGKGNYNQQLFERSLLFEFGTNLIEKDLVLKSTYPLAKTIDVVLFGTESAGSESLEDIDAQNSSGDTLEAGLVAASSAGAGTEAGLSTLWIVLICIGGVALLMTIVLIASPKARYKIKRFFSELTGGLTKAK